MAKRRFSIPARHIARAKSLLGLHTSAGRYYELDLVRGIAICVMVAFHFSWDLQFFSIISPAFFEQYIRPIYNLAAVFVLLVGAGLTISYRRAVQARVRELDIFKRFLVRGVVIFAIGMGITLVFLIGNRLNIISGTVDFGILHLVGFSIVAAFPFVRFGLPNLVLGLAVLLVGYIYIDVNMPTIEGPWLVWLGIHSPNYVSQDYFPLLPWFGWVLVGVGLGNLLYLPPDGRRFKIPDISNWHGVRQLTIIGRNSLLIYIVHQPILFPIVWFIALFV